MTTIVLIHGSTQNATCWDLVRPELAAAGHDTIAVDLPADRPDFSATDFARVAVDQMNSAPDDCIVVAHSASGIFLPIIAHLRPVRAVVYLAAMIPRPGMSAMEQYQQHPEMLNPGWVAAGPRWSDPANWRALADEFLFHDVLLTMREWAYSTLRPMRIDGALRERLTADTAVPSLVIVATEDRALNPEWQRSAFRALENVTAEGNSGGHCPHVSTPKETASSIVFACDPEEWERSRDRVRERLKSPPPAPAPGPIDYEAFKRLTWAEQVATFRTLTPQNRYELVSTHVSRWVETNRNRFTPAQIATAEEWLASITPRIFERPGETRHDAMKDRLYSVFSREELAPAHYRAPYIPPPGTANESRHS